MIDLSSIRFRGYQTKSVDEAVKGYRRTVKQNPTLILANWDAYLTGDLSLVVRCGYVAADVLLLTDQLTVDDWAKNEVNHVPIKKVELQREDSAAHSPRNGLYHQSDNDGKDESDSKCPVCNRKIENFNALGYWPGWVLSITPPYWEALREFVFHRDSYTCQNCGEVFKNHTELRAHHIKPKEEGGSDSARNLTTLCHNCHPDEHPIYPEARETKEIYKISSVDLGWLYVGGQ